MTKSIDDLLVEAIPETLKAANVQAPVYCMFLSYCSSNPNLPPCIFLAREEARQVVLTEAAEEELNPDYDAIWYVDELDAPLIIDFDERIDEAWNKFYQSIRGSYDYALITLPMRRVAKRLNEIDWSTILSITDDFVVTAADSSDGVDFWTDLQASISPNQFALLRDRRLLLLVRDED